MDAQRCLWACLGFSWPHVGLSRVLLIDAWLARLPFLQVSLAQGAAGHPANVQSGCGGCSYLVFWRSSRSQVGSVWPILYSSLESSTLWSR